MKRSLLTVLTVLNLFTVLLVVSGEDKIESSPWVGWRKGYESYDRAGAFKDDNQFEKALALYIQSRDYFAAIKKHFPNWNQTVVEGRIKLCNSEIEAMKKLVSPSRRSGSVHAEIPAAAPERISYQNDYPASSGSSRNSQQPRRSRDSRSEIYPAGGNSRLYIEMQSEIDQYRQRLRKALMEIDSLQLKLQQSETRSRDVEGILRDYRLLQEKYALLEVQYKSALERAMTGDRERYDRQLTDLKSANDEAMKLVRKLEAEIVNKDKEYAVSRQEVLKLRDEVKNLTNDKRRLERNLELARNQSVRGKSADTAEQHEKIRFLESELKRKDQRIDRLMLLLSESPEGKSGTVSPAAEKELRRLRAELDDLQKSSIGETELRRKVSNLTAQAESLKKQLADANELLKVRDNEVKVARSSENKLKNSLEVVNNELKILKTQAGKLDADIRTYQKKYGELDKRHQDRLKSHSEAVDKLQKERAQNQNLLLETQKKLRMQTEELDKLRRSCSEQTELVKSSRNMIIELKAKLHSAEIELKKMAALQKAYDELKARFDLINQAGNSDVLATLNRIPGLEESLRRYEKENSELHKEITGLKKRLNQQAGIMTPADETAYDREKINALLSEGRSAEVRGNREIAVWAYRQVLVRDSDNQAAAAGLGKLLLSEGKFSEAAELLSKAVKNDKTNSDLTVSCARALIGKRDYPAALQLLDNLKKLRKGKIAAPALLTEAVAYSRSGKNAEAEKAFRAVLRMEPANAEAAYELALILSADEKRRKEAGEFYMLAKSNGIAVDSYLEDLLRSFSGPDRATRDFLLNNITEALQNNDMASAAWYLAEVKKLYPEDAEYKAIQAVYHLCCNQFGEVIKLYSKPADDREKYLCAAALACAGDIKAAEKMLPAAGKIKNLPHVLKGHLLRQTGKLDKTFQQKLLNKLP